MDPLLDRLSKLMHGLDRIPEKYEEIIRFFIFINRFLQTVSPDTKTLSYYPVCKIDSNVGYVVAIEEQAFRLLLTQEAEKRMTSVDGATLALEHVNAVHHRLMPAAEEMLDGLGILAAFERYCEPYLSA